MGAGWHLHRTEGDFGGGPSERRLIRGWLRGEEDEPPLWVAVLDAAREWGIAPWQVEAEASKLWWDRWLCLKVERKVKRDSDAERAKGANG